MHEVRVHADRRACITAQLLKNFASTAGLSKLPKKVFVVTSPAGIKLRWTSVEGSKTYDLSVRERVLVAGFKPGMTLSVVSMDADQMALAVDGAKPAPSSGETPPKAAKTPSTTPNPPSTASRAPRRSRRASRPSRPRSAPRPQRPARPAPTRKEPSSVSQLNTLVIAGLCTDVRRNHSSLSLLEVAKTLDDIAPGVTVGDLVDKDGRIIITYDDVTKRPAARARSTSPTPSARPAKPTQSAKKSKPVKTSITLREFLADRLASSKGGISVNDLAKDTTFSLPAIRDELNKMIADGQAKKTGNTRATRYYPR